MKNIIIFLFLFPYFVFSQQQVIKHHTVRIKHKSRVITDKQYEQKVDSSSIGYEFFIGNSNSWTGENYIDQPSAQVLITYDNNKNYEVGFFACVNKHGFNHGNTNGSDVFFSRKLFQNITFIFDDYFFLGNKDSLANDFGYNSKTYNLYTAKLKYDFNAKTDFILAYSLFNDREERQQSVTLEFDYNITDYISFVLAYSTSTEVLNFKEGSFGTGIGFLGQIGTINNSPVRLGMTLNPIFERAYSSFDRELVPFSIIISIDI